ARVKFNLAIIARDRPDDVESERLFNEALDLFAKDPRAAQGDDATSLLNLGFLCKNQRRFADAESYLNRSLAAYALVVGAHTDVANAHYQLGDVYSMEARNTEAADEYKKAIDMWEKLEGPNGFDVQHALPRLAMIQSEQGKTSEANDLLTRSQS